jgi:hypothetical protein
MKLIVTFLCMGLIVFVATALVVIDLIIKLLPLIIIAVVALVGLRISHRRREPATALRTPSAAQCNVPDTAAFVSASQAADLHAARQPDIVNDERPRRYVSTYQQDHTVIDAEVISEDDHRG